ncbi:MAG: hypothetical protein AMXMBFR6_05140 [Betaproteobacteria bacterium]
MIDRIVLKGCLGMLCLGFAVTAFAERADRDKPVNLEADKVTVDDRNKIQVFEGRVTMTQGTLTIRGDKIVITQDAEGYQRGVAYGSANSLARFRQKREGKDIWFEGEAERIEHDAKTEVARFFDRAWVRNGDDEVRGQYIEYDGITENYVVTNGPNATTVPRAGTGNRVRALIQPKRKDGPVAPTAAPAGGQLKPSRELASPVTSGAQP